MRQIKILIVEDEKKIASSLSKGLSEQKFYVDIANDGLEGKKMINEKNYNLVLIDIYLPFIDGMELCRYVRSNHPKTFVIVLSAMNTINDEIDILASGAHDYLSKPFNFNELVDHIKPLFRPGGKSVKQNKTVKIADLIIDTKKREVIRDGKPILLTDKEFQLLEYLIKNKNKTVSITEIAAAVWGIDFEGESNLIDVYINLLCKKINKDFSHKLIYGFAGIGYVLKEETK